MSSADHRVIVRRGWIWLLIVFLVVWLPVRFALELSATMNSIGWRGPMAILELVGHGLVTALAVAAGLALTGEAPHAPGFAGIALVAVAGMIVQTLFWSILPGQTAPGDRLPGALISMAHSAAWIVYLRRSRTARTIYGQDALRVGTTIRSNARV